jgi:hypothetical protein
MLSDNELIRKGQLQPCPGEHGRPVRGASE